MFPNPNMFPGFRPQSMGGMYAQQQVMAVTPVTGMAQVEAAQVSFDGTPAFFYDTATDAIYIKQFNPQNGTSPVTVYRKEAPQNAPQYATVEMLAELEHRITAILNAQETSDSTKRRVSTKKEVDAE